MPHISYETVSKWFREHKEKQVTDRIDQMTHDELKVALGDHPQVSFSKAFLKAAGPSAVPVHGLGSAPDNERLLDISGTAASRQPSYEEQVEYALGKPIDEDSEPATIGRLRVVMANNGWRPVVHPQGRSYIEIVTNPESSEPKRETWVKT